MLKKSRFTDRRDYTTAKTRRGPGGVGPPL